MVDPPTADDEQQEQWRAPPQSDGELASLSAPAHKQEEPSMITIRGDSVMVEAVAADGEEQEQQRKKGTTNSTGSSTKAEQQGEESDKTTSRFCCGHCSKRQRLFWVAALSLIAILGAGMFAYVFFYSKDGGGSEDGGDGDGDNSKEGVTSSTDNSDNVDVDDDDGASLSMLLTASDASRGDQKGTSVAIVSSMILAGAHAKNNSTGAVYVFAFGGVPSSAPGATVKWTQRQTLVASDGRAGDGFGFSVAVAGTTAVIGAPGIKSLDDSDSPPAGRAYVYTFSEATQSWTEQAQLAARDETDGNRYGFHVAISESDSDNQTTVVVGAPYRKNWLGRQRSGAAYVFVASSGDEQQWTEQARLTSTDMASLDSFGKSVAINSRGDRIAVGGAAEDDENDDNDSFVGGSVFVFAREQPTPYRTGWTEQGRLTSAAAPGGGDGDGSENNSDQLFARSIALSGRTLAVGAPHPSSEGSVYVFEQQLVGEEELEEEDSTTTWTLQEEIRASDGAKGDRFGASLALEGGTLVVGARLHDAGGVEDAGAAYVFRRSSSSSSEGGAATITWTEIAKVGVAAAIQSPDDAIAAAAAAFDWRGAAVAFGGPEDDVVAVGAPGTNRGAAAYNAGGVYVERLPQT